MMSPITLQPISPIDPGNDAWVREYRLIITADRDAWVQECAAGGGWPELAAGERPVCLLPAGVDPRPLADVIERYIHDGPIDNVVESLSDEIVGRLGELPRVMNPSDWVADPDVGLDETIREIRAAGGPRAWAEYEIAATETVIVGGVDALTSAAEQAQMEGQAE